jgi:hypothetical protein
MAEQNIPRIRAASNWLELLGAVGLLLPGLTGIATWLTPLAALGLVLVMIGAIAFHLSRREVLHALLPLAIALGAAYVAYGRAFVTPLM